MKHLITIISIVILFFSCQKSEPIPETYIGTWHGKEKIYLTSKLYTITIEMNGEATYKKETYINVNSSGKVKINGDELRIGKSKFSIDQAPTLIDTVNNTYEMILDSVVYSR
ncbi:hypothetical protein [Crocinitomix catalasitica]|uniref:hypothetical protein n=1 Tax=Crocinitomix catalasitica TaxID=184607 RepID=UPI000486C5E4|nr:hypothetical protein [Crocinitomix catalasitica]